MAYSPIKPAGADPTTTTYHNLTLGTTPSPRLADLPLTPLSLSFDDFEGDGTIDEPSASTGNPDSRVSKFLSSLTSSSRRSYDLVEDDDYEVTEQVTPVLERRPRGTTTNMAESTDVDRPIRTASVSRRLPMNHPVPDLQSLQGAYVKNVERLEESAVQLSMRSSLEGELQRIKHEQRQRERTASDPSRTNSAKSVPNRRLSTKSLANSIVEINSAARSTSVSASAHVASPVGSIKSPRSNYTGPKRRPSKSSRLSQTFPEPEFEGRPLDVGSTSLHSTNGQNLDPRPARSPSPSASSRAERPTTSGSGDTYQQAKSLFTDFDGVHYAPDRHARQSRRISLARPPRARDSRAFKEPQPGEEMIYYPAPVPVMLNLPMRLSKMNWADNEKRRLKALSSIPDDMRKSAAWLANEDSLPASNPRHSVLPPQLRASAFFDHRGTTQDVQLKNGSAVATLDSILDAAAHAPVSAFTDHPIAGHLGDDFYSGEQPSRKSMQPKKEKVAKRKSSISNLLKPKRSSGNMSEAMARESRVPSSTLAKRDEDPDADSDPDHTENDADKSIAPDADELPDQEDDGEGGEEEDGESDTDSESHESQFRPGFSAAPTTLLAELQMRKAQQKMRNRTAADAFPNGMHSTLLELDTVTQLQQKARKQKHIKLAWEDKDLVDKENFDDDDVPLGMLFPEKEQQNHVNVNRPLGLMEKKELEENEPLSQRRARLRGEPLQPPAPSRSPGLSHKEEESDRPVLDLPNLGDQENDEDNEGETLAQRRQRMKNRKENGTSAEFARHLSSELGLKVEEPDSAPTSKTPEVEETLGQRRKRLQAEALSGGYRNVSGDSQGLRPVLRPKKSLADVLRANPVGFVDPSEAKTAHLAMLTQERAKEREAKYLAAQQADRERSQTNLNRFGHGNQAGLIQAPLTLHQGYQQPYAPMSGAYVPGNPAMNYSQTNFGYPNINSFNTQPTYGSPGMGAMNAATNYPYQQPMASNIGYNPAMDFSGMGPPLDPKQRARIEGWRQGVM